jgi:hypothetical protein
MKQNLKQPLLLLAVAVGIALSAVPGWGLEPYSMKPAELQTKDFPQSIADALEVRGWRIFTYSNGIEDPICEIFWAKVLVAQDTPSPVHRGENPILYGTLQPGTLVGVIHFLPESRPDFREDFHDQKLSPGYYTMRYAVMAEGDSRDFVLLSRLSDDHDPGRVPSIADLGKLGRQASGSDQAAILRLSPIYTEHVHYPDVIMADDGSCVLQTKLFLKKKNGVAQEFPLAIILAAPPEEEGGS